VDEMREISAVYDSNKLLQGVRWKQQYIIDAVIKTVSF
jgi:hypothetical protein